MCWPSLHIRQSVHSQRNSNKNTPRGTISAGGIVIVLSDRRDGYRFDRSILLIQSTLAESDHADRPGDFIVYVRWPS